MTPLDVTTAPQIAQVVASDKLDAPAGSTVLRIEPVLEDADFAKGLWIVVAFVVTWPDGTDWAGSAMLKTGGKSSPAYQVGAPNPLDGAKIMAQAFAIDGAVKLGVRLTSAGDAKSLPAALRVQKVDVADQIDIPADAKGA